MSLNICLSVLTTVVLTITTKGCKKLRKKMGFVAVGWALSPKRQIWSLPMRHLPDKSSSFALPPYSSVTQRISLQENPKLPVFHSDFLTNIILYSYSLPPIQSQFTMQKTQGDVRNPFLEKQCIAMS